MSCIKASNNKHFNSPPLMADGRNFTDYRPNYELNNEIMDKNKISNSHNYRVFLSRNADVLMDNNKEENAKHNQRFECVKPYSMSTMVPDKTKVKCNSHKCEVVLNDENGFGQGRIYNDEPNGLLDPLTEPEYVFENNICSDPSNSFEYFPLNKNDKDRVLRHSTSGGDMLEGGNSDIIF